ncbi:MAG: HAD-IA family hydrolase [Polaromonas sp.]
MIASKPQALLFDLGGVVIDIDFDRVFRAWQPISRLSFQDIKRAFQCDAHYEQHERGEISAHDYFEHLSRTLDLNANCGQIAAGWNHIFVREISETAQMVHAVRAQVPCYAFTNTNATHLLACTSLFVNLTSSFDRVFASHEIGFRKPERRAFEHIAHAIGVPVASIMFFDDSLANVDGATLAGLQAVHVSSPSDVRRALDAAGFALERPEDMALSR